MKTPRLAIAMLALFVGLTVAACSENAEDFSDEELRTKLIEVLTEDGTIDEPTATCTIDYVFDNLDRDDINQLANAQEIEDATEEQVQVLTDGVTGCLTGG